MAHLTPLGPNKALRFDAVSRMLQQIGHQPKRILEIGCGQGAFACRLAQQADYVGLEPDSRSFSVAQRRLADLGRGEVLNASFDGYDPEEEFDLVCAFEVIEHLADDRGELAKWSSVLEPGGVLLVSTPADPKRYNAYDQYVGHFRRYEPEALTDVLGSARLTDVRVERYGYPFYNLLEVGLGAMAKVRLKRSGPESPEDRTSQSGRVFNAPPMALEIGALFHPMLQRWQRRVPERGPGLIACGRKPI